MTRPSIWKILGLAGVAGVAATGALLARAERQRRALQPEEVRARLQERLAAIDAGDPASDVAPGPPRPRKHLSVVMGQLRHCRKAATQHLRPHGQ